MAQEPIEIGVNRIIEEAHASGLGRPYIFSQVAIEFPQLSWEEINIFLEEIYFERQWK